MSEHISHLEPSVPAPGKEVPPPQTHERRYCPKCRTVYSVDYHGRCFHCDKIVQPHLAPASWWLEGGTKCRCGYPEDQPDQPGHATQEPKRIGREFL